MAFNGAGVYSPPATDFPAVSNTLIQATKFNNVINDIATGLSTCLTKDGQQTVTANIPFAGFYATNVGIRHIAGLVGTPGLAWNDDPSSGFYRIGANDYGYAVNGVKVQETTAAAHTLSQNLLFSADNTYDIGAVGATRARDFFLGRNATIGGTATLGGNVTVTTASVPTLTLTAPGVNSGALIRLTATNTQLNWQLSQNTYVVGAFEITPSTAGGGTTFSNPAYQIAAAGHSFFNLSGAEQVRIAYAAAATRYITLTGSNGGNPTIGTSAGDLAFSGTTDSTSVASGSLILAGGLGAAKGISAGFAFETYGPYQANTASKGTFSQADSATTQITAFGADAATFGTLVIRQAKSTGGGVAAITISGAQNINLGTGTVAAGGVVTVTNAGTASALIVTGSNNATMDTLNSRNTSNGNAAVTRLSLGNDGAIVALSLNKYSTLHATKANRVEIQNEHSAGLYLSGDGGGHYTVIDSSGIVTSTGHAVTGTPATVGGFRGVYGVGAGGPTVTCRNSGDTANMTLISSDTRNSVVDCVMVGLTSTNGVVLKARSGGAAPTTSDLAVSEWCLWRDTGGATTKLYYNNAGAIQAVALA